MFVGIGGFILFCCLIYAFHLIQESNNTIKILRNEIDTRLSNIEDKIDLIGYQTERIDDNVGDLAEVKFNRERQYNSNWMDHNDELKKQGF